MILYRDELRLAVALTKCPFDDSDPVQLQILQTIYKQLTGDIFDCPRYINYRHPSAKIVCRSLGKCFLQVSKE